MATEKRDRQRANRQLKQIEVAKQEQRQRMTRRGVVGGLIAVGGLALVIGIAAIGGAFSGDDDEGDVAAGSTVVEGGFDTSGSLAPGSTTTTVPTSLPAFAYGTGECPPAEVAEPVKTFADAPQLCIDAAKTYTATIETSKGDIVAELDAAEMTGTVNNFVTLARYGYYDDTLIFRADPTIDIVQGGGIDNTGGPGYEIPDESNGFTYTEGDLVMARTGAPNSAGGQWFVAGGPNVANLDGQGTYVTFGTVTEGLEIVQEMIANVGPDGQTPGEEVTVSTVTITES